MEEKVWQFIQKHHMLEAGDRIVAGISGGGDSMALLFLLLKFRERCGYEVCAVHVNHGIRGDEAFRDETLVTKYCADRNVDCEVFHCSVPEAVKKYGWSEEEAGRILRRQAYEQVLRQWKGNKVALAHHQNDQAETMLHNLSRGCGLRGIRGMLPVQNGMIRPFLCIERREIDHYLKEKKIPYRTDSTNFSDQYIRNRIRKHVVEYLERNVNSKTVSHMAWTAGIAAQAEEYLCGQGERILAQYGELLPGEIRISDDCLGEPSILRMYGFLQALEKVSGYRKDLSGEHLEQISRLFQKETGKQVSLPGGTTAVRVYGGIIIRKTVKEKVETRKKMWTLPVPGRIQCGKAFWETRIFSYESQKIPEQAYTKWFDYDRIKKTLQIRNRRPGDRIMVTAQGGRKKLKDYFIDEKIPREQRDELILLAEEEEVLWIVGKRISEAYKITEFTKRVLEVKYQGGREVE